MKLRIRKIRRAQGMTLQTLADGAGISLSYLSEIETGIKTANMRRLDSIARVLSVQPADLMDDAGADTDLSALIENYCSLPSRRQKAVLDLSCALRDDVEPERE